MAGSVSILSFLSTLFSGICVGAADIVPGISGGTVAFIIGIYEKLLASIASFNAKAFSLLLRFKLREFFTTVHWQFLLAFVTGVSISFVSLAKGFQYLLNDEALRALLYSAFMGLVVGSCFFCGRLIPRFSLKNIALLIFGAVIAYALSGADLAPKSSEPTYNIPLQKPIESGQSYANYDAQSGTLLDVSRSLLPVMVAKSIIHKDDLVVDSVTGASCTIESRLEATQSPFFDFWVVVCGMMAISAMLLPGISGSYILNILGMYGFVLGALVDWVEGLKMGYFDFASFQIVASMALGIILGALLFARVVSYLLANFRQATLAILVGFMIGALRAVWPFWSYSYYLSPLHLYDGPRLAPTLPVMPTVLSMDFLIACLFFCGGLATVFFVEYMANKKRPRIANMLEG